MALSRIDTTNMIEDVPQSKIDNNINFRNIIINGDMSIAQRGTSATGIGNGDTGYHTVDRWKFFENDSPSYEFTMSQSTDVPSGYGFATSLKMDCTTANGSLSSNSVLYFQQKIEGQNLQYLKKGTSSAESLTLSFWVKATKTGTNIVELRDMDNSRSISKSYSISSTNTSSSSARNAVSSDEPGSGHIAWSGCHFVSGLGNLQIMRLNLSSFFSDCIDMPSRISFSVKVITDADD